jgi:hypothetical protein
MPQQGVPRSVDDMETLPLFLLMLIPALVATVTVAAMAPRLNAQARERRAAQAARG